MQGLTVEPRSDLTADQVRALLTGDYVEVNAGLELLDGSNLLVTDISDDMVSGEVSRDNAAEVHGACNLTLSRALIWGRDRVRPYMTLSNGVVTARFNLGVYVLTSPVTPHGDNPITYTTEGYDLLYILHTSGPGDTWIANSGVTYLNAIQAVVAAAGVGVTVLLDGTRQTTTIPDPMVWVLTDQNTATWLVIVNDLLAAIGYRPLWCDQDGRLRSGPFQPAWARAVEWRFNTADASTNLVGENRETSADVWGVPNWWRFVRKGMTTEPVIDAGIYLVTNEHDGPTSYDVVGRWVRDVQYLDVADQNALVAEGDRIVYTAKQKGRQYTISVDPLPIAGHCDVVQFTDQPVNDKCQVLTWAMPLDGSQGQWLLEVAQ